MQTTTSELLAVLGASQEADIEAYKAALAAHDWFYDFSDDFSVWSRGNRERQELRRMAQRLDKGFTIWNSHAPEMFRVLGA